MYGYYGSSYFGKFLDVFDRVGFFDLFLPFLIYFLIIFGLLERIDLLGKMKAPRNVKSDEGDRTPTSDKSDSRKINLLLSFAMSMLILYYYPASRSLGEVLSKFLTEWGVFALFLLLIPLGMAALGVPIMDIFYTATEYKEGDQTKTRYELSGIGWAVLVLVFVVLTVLFYHVIAPQFPIFNVLINPYYLGVFLTIVIIIVLLIVVGMG